MSNLPFLCVLGKTRLQLSKVPLLLPVSLGLQRKPEVHISASPHLILAYLSLGSKDFKLVNVVFNNIFEVSMKRFRKQVDPITLQIGSLDLFF